MREQRRKAARPRPISPGIKYPVCWWGASRLLLGGRLSSVCRRLAALGSPPPLPLGLLGLPVLLFLLLPLLSCLLAFLFPLSYGWWRSPIWPLGAAATCHRPSFLAQRTGYPTPRVSAPPALLDIGGWGPAFAGAGGGKVLFGGTPHSDVRPRATR